MRFLSTILGFPPTCSHCHELGHIIRNCLHYTPPPPEKDPQVPASSNRKEVGKKIRKYVPKSTATTKNASQTNEAGKGVSPDNAQPALDSTLTTSSNDDLVQGNSCDLPQPSEMMIVDPLQLSPSSTLNRSSSFASDTFSSPDPVPRPSLKRSRSSPTLSPSFPSKQLPPPHPSSFLTTTPSKTPPPALQISLPSSSNPFLPPLKPSSAQPLPPASKLFIIIPFKLFFGSGIVC